MIQRQPSLVQRLRSVCLKGQTDQVRRRARCLPDTWKRGQKNQTSHPHVSRRVPSVEAHIRVRHHSASRHTGAQWCQQSHSFSFSRPPGLAHSPSPVAVLPSNLDRSSHAAMERQPASGCLAICTSVHRSERRVTRWTFLAAPQTTPWPLHSHAPLTSPTPPRPSPSSAQPAPTLLMLRAVPPRRGCHQPAPRLSAPRHSPCAAPPARPASPRPPRLQKVLHCAVFSNWTGSQGDGSQGDGAADSDSTFTATSCAETLCDGLRAEREEFQRRRLSLPDGTFSSKRARRSRAVMTSKRGVSRRKPRAHGTMVSVVSR